MIKMVTVREVRKQMAFHLNAQTPILIGDSYHQRAILIPLNRRASWNADEEKKAIARAREAAKKALEELEKIITTQ